MPKRDVEGASLKVLTHKEGVLSRVAHDLEIKVCSFSLTADIDENGKWKEIQLVADPESLRVVGARVGERVVAGKLSGSDKQTIEENIRRDVLRTHQHRRVEFLSENIRRMDAGRYQLDGVLTLCGEKRDLSASVFRDGNFWSTSVRIHQPDFGIRPYTAMLGALRIKPKVDVLLTVPAEKVEEEGADQSG